MCVDPCFLAEKLASGVYWAVNAALKTDKKAETSTRTLQFSRLWGKLFEEYVFEMLRHAVPSDRLIENVML